MKQVKLMLAILLFVGIGTITSAQTDSKKSAQKTETLKVWGECDMCKARIEKAVKAEGATSADWVVKTKLLTVTYDPAKTNTDALSKKLAAVGHDTEKYKSTDEAYSKLPGCCHYERTK